MKLDHIAFRVKNKSNALDYFRQLFGYKLQETFYPFKGAGDNNELIECSAMQPKSEAELSPEFFISAGPIGSIVGDWVKNKGGGGIHHIAFNVSNIDAIVVRWKLYGVEFTSEIIDCPEDNLRQIFTKPLDALGNIIIELIERGDKGFCSSSIARLMESTI